MADPIDPKPRIYLAEQIKTKDPKIYELLKHHDDTLTYIINVLKLHGLGL